MEIKVFFFVLLLNLTIQLLMILINFLKNNFFHHNFFKLSTYVVFVSINAYVFSFLLNYFERINILGINLMFVTYCIITILIAALHYLFDDDIFYSLDKILVGFVMIIFSTIIYTAWFFFVI